jgi:NitT/TauT family transport system substrate-binding protein
VGKPERSSLRLGLPLPAASFLPIYLAQDDLFQQEGLSVDVVSFNADTDAVQAIASGTVDIAVPSMIGLVNLVNSGQPVIGFYGGYNQADISWLAQPSIKSWSDLKGKTVAVASIGSLSDYLTRSVIRKHGLDPEKDVQMVAGGSAANSLAALRAGRADAIYASAPFKWQAESEGFTLLGTQAVELGAEWPKGSYVARKEFIDQNPNTIKAFLRAHVRAIRQGKADPATATETLKRVLKYDDQFADKAQAEVLSMMDERGRLPSASMGAFWGILQQTGDVTEPWSEDRLLDRRFVDTFDQWAPR